MDRAPSDSNPSHPRLAPLAALVGLVPCTGCAPCSSTWPAACDLPAPARARAIPAEPTLSFGTGTVINAPFRVAQRSGFETTAPGRWTRTRSKSWGRASGRPSPSARIPSIAQKPAAPVLWSIGGRVESVRRRSGEVTRKDEVTVTAVTVSQRCTLAALAAGPEVRHYGQGRRAGPWAPGRPLLRCMSSACSSALSVLRIRLQGSRGSRKRTYAHILAAVGRLRRPAGWPSGSLEPGVPAYSSSDCRRHPAHRMHTGWSARRFALRGQQTIHTVRSRRARRSGRSWHMRRPDACLFRRACRLGCLTCPIVQAIKLPVTPAGAALHHAPPAEPHSRALRQRQRRASPLPAASGRADPAPPTQTRDAQRSSGRSSARGTEERRVRGLSCREAWSVDRVVSYLAGWVARMLVKNGTLARRQRTQADPASPPSARGSPALTGLLCPRALVPSVDALCRHQTQSPKSQARCRP